MPRGGENHAQGGEKIAQGGEKISRALRARRTVYFFPPWPILVVRPCLYNQKYIFYYFFIINFLPKSCSVKKKDLVPSLKNIHLNNYFLCLICLFEKD